METMQCSSCRRNLAADQFNERSPGRPYRTCRPCMAVRMRQRYEANAAEVRQRQRERHLKSKFGMTVDEFDALLAKQGGGCAACGATETTVHPRTGAPFSLAIDHDHSTGAVRGLLCRHCNLALGYTNDDVDRLRALIDYLQAER